jgi:uncharacterized damage-inducible protein DinB
MSEAEYAADNGFTYKSIRGILTHCLDGEYGWRCLLEGEAAPDTLAGAQFATPELLAARWREEEAKMRKYLAELSDEELAGDLVWQTTDGGERRLPNLWLSLAHVVNHSTQHRSEAAEALTMVGRSPGGLDLVVYSAERLKP